MFDTLQEKNRIEEGGKQDFDPNLCFFVSIEIGK